LLETLDSIRHSKTENACADCNTPVKMRRLIRITLPESGNIQFSMNLLLFQNVMTPATLLSFLFLRKTPFYDTDCADFTDQNQ
jgi:hypothetical protein